MGRRIILIVSIYYSTVVTGVLLLSLRRLGEPAKHLQGRGNYTVPITSEATQAFLAAIYVLRVCKKDEGEEAASFVPVLQ